MDAEPLCDKARALLDDDEDRHDEAIALLRQALAAREPSAVDFLARAYLDRGYRHEAIELLSPRIRAGQPELALQLADVQTTIGDFERAEQAYRIAVADGDASAMNNLGILLRGRGRLREAEVMLRRAAEAGDERAPAHLVAVQWELYGDPRAALATAQYWADETRPGTLHALAFIRAATGQYGEAERTYRQAASLGAHRGHIEFAAFLQDLLGDMERAEAELELAEREQEPGWADAFGQFLAEAGRIDEARAYLAHAAHWGSLEALATLNELDGDPDDD
jgi:Tfp pilus assembly protein PilF